MRDREREGFEWVERRTDRERDFRRGRGSDSRGHEEKQEGEVEGCKEKMVKEEKGIGKSDAVQKKYPKV